MIILRSLCIVLFFFFQAEDGIRDLTVTGVQTCALPISVGGFPPPAHARAGADCRPPAGRIVRGTPPVAAPLGPGPATVLPAPRRQSRQRSRLTLHSPRSRWTGANRRP